MSAQRDLSSFFRPSAEALFSAARSDSHPDRPAALYGLTIELLRTIKYVTKLHAAAPERADLKGALAALDVEPAEAPPSVSFSGWVIQVVDRDGVKLAMKVRSGRRMAVARDLTVQALDLLRDRLDGAPCALVGAWLRSILSGELTRHRECDILALVARSPPSISGLRLVLPIRTIRSSGAILMPWIEGRQVTKWDELPERQRASVIGRLGLLHRSLLSDHSLLRLDTHPSNFFLERGGDVVVFDWTTVLVVSGPPRAGSSTLRRPASRRAAKELLVAAARSEVDNFYRRNGADS